MAGISSKALKPDYIENKRKFIGQEFDDNLGWNMYQFKYRSHDPQIGRFIQVDPLASDYVYNSTYAYAENKLGLGFDLEGLELQEFNKMFRAAGINVQQKNNQVQVKAIEIATKAEPYIEGTLKVAKYTAINAGILTGNPVAIALAIPALGLNITKDVLEARKPDDPKVKEIPTGMGEALGMVVDKTKEKITGDKSNGLGQSLGGLVESLLGIKDVFKKPIVSQKPAENIDKINTVVDVVEGGKEVVEKVKEASNMK